MGGFGGRVGVSQSRRSCARYGGSGGVLGGHFLQRPAPAFIRKQNTALKTCSENEKYLPIYRLKRREKSKKL
jgi:hypothetical protein